MGMSLHLEQGRQPAREVGQHVKHEKHEKHETHGGKGGSAHWLV